VKMRLSSLDSVKVACTIVVGASVTQGPTAQVAQDQGQPGPK